MSHYDLDRDLPALGDFYTAHVDAMTREKLHSKSDIAAELAHRDREIALGKAAIRMLQEDVLAASSKLSTGEERYQALKQERDSIWSRLEERSIVEAKLLEQLAVADAYSTRLEKQLEEQECRLGVYKTALEQIVRRDYTGASYVALEALRDAERVVEKQEQK